MDEVNCSRLWRRIWPLAPWQLVNAVSMAVAVRFCPFLLLCCRMGSQGDGSNVVDGMSSSAPPISRDSLGYHGHLVDWRGCRSPLPSYIYVKTT